jgi:4-hydroxybenzoate polyprenyltransferase
VSGPPGEPRPWNNLARFLELQNLGLNLSFALAFLFVAAEGLPSLRTFLLIVIAFIAARTAGHSFNRYADRRFDLETSRTRQRPAVADRRAEAFALGLAAGSGAVVIVAAYFLNPLAFLLSPVALALVFGYSYTKRFTSLTTIFLGLVEAATPAAIFIAVQGALPWEALAAVIAMLSWGVAFELIHSLGDIENDRRLGLHSLPARLGPERSRSLVPLFHAVALAVFTVFGLLAGLTVPFFAALVVMAGMLVFIDRGLFSVPTEVRRPFRLHFLLGIVFLIGTTWAVFAPLSF